MSSKIAGFLLLLFMMKQNISLKTDILSESTPQIMPILRETFDDNQMTKYRMQVATNLKTIRIMSKLTQKDFGALLGFSARTISDWECANTEPDIKTLRNITKIFDVSYEDILDWIRTIKVIKKIR